MEFRELLNKAVPFEFEYDGFVVTGEVYRYRPNKEFWDAKKAEGIVDEKLAEAVVKGGVEGATSDPEKAKIADKLFNLQIVGMLKTWDASFDGVELPIDLDSVEKLCVLMPSWGIALYQKLTERRNENPPNGTSSSPGSPEKAETESVPTGIEPDGSSTAPLSTGIAPSSIS